MVQGASQVAGRFPELLRMYKAPPPEISSEQFYETDDGAGSRAASRSRRVSPLPIGWAEHVLADGHWGDALREYMRDYNHWAVLGSLCELLPLPDNRVTLADERDRLGMPIARFDYSQCDNDRANIAFAKRMLNDILQAAGAQDILAIDRYAHLVGGCRMGTSPEHSVSTRTTASGTCPTCSSPTARAMPTQGSQPALTVMARRSRRASGGPPAGRASRRDPAGRAAVRVIGGRQRRPPPTARPATPRRCYGGAAAGHHRPAGGKRRVRPRTPLASPASFAGRLRAISGAAVSLPAYRFLASTARCSCDLFIFDRPSMPMFLGLVVELIAGSALGPVVPDRSPPRRAEDMSCVELRDAVLVWPSAPAPC